MHGAIRGLEEDLLKSRDETQQMKTINKDLLSQLKLSTQGSPLQGGVTNLEDSLIQENGLNTGDINQSVITDKHNISSQVNQGKTSSTNESVMHNSTQKNRAGDVTKIHSLY